MPLWISLIRGINVGGRNILPMAELVRDLESVGCTDIRTYIQSGNAVFRSSTRSGDALARKIAAAIARRHEFTPAVLAIDADALRAVVRALPFEEAELAPKTVHCFFLARAPKAPDVEALDATRRPSERFVLTDRALYLHAPDGVAGSKLASSVEKYLGVTATARNWRTVMKLLAFVERSTDS